MFLCSKILGGDQLMNWVLVWRSLCFHSKWLANLDHMIVPSAVWPHHGCVFSESMPLENSCCLLISISHRVHAPGHNTKLKLKLTAGFSIKTLYRVNFTHKYLIKFNTLGHKFSFYFQKSSWHTGISFLSIVFEIYKATSTTKKNTKKRLTKRF